MDEIRLYTRVGSPFVQAAIQLPHKLLRISTKKTDEKSAYAVAYKKYVQEKTKFEMGIVNDQITVGQLFTQWPKVSERTNYASMYRNHIQPKWGKEPLYKLQSKVVKTWLLSLPVSDTVRFSVAVVMRGLIRFGIESGYLNETFEPNFSIKFPDHNPRQALNQTDLVDLKEKIRFWIDGDTNGDRRDALLPFFYAIVILVGSGLRPGKEVLDLKWSDFGIWSIKDGKPRYKLTIRPEQNKTKRGREVVLDSDTAYDIDVKWRLIQVNWGHYSEDGYMFLQQDGTKYTGLRRHWLEYCRKSGLSGKDIDQQLTLYSIRHAYITRKIMDGVPLQFIAKQCGNSVPVIEKWYNKVIATDVASYFE